MLRAGTVVSPGELVPMGKAMLTTRLRRDFIWPALSDLGDSVIFQFGNSIHIGAGFQGVCGR